MTKIKIESTEIDVDLTRVMADVYIRNDPVSTKMVEKRLKAGKIDRAFKMAYAGLAKGPDGKLIMSFLEFAKKYEVV